MGWMEGSLTYRAGFLSDRVSYTVCMCQAGNGRGTLGDPMCLFCASPFQYVCAGTYGQKEVERGSAGTGTGIVRTSEAVADGASLFRVDANGRPNGAHC